MTLPAQWVAGNRVIRLDDGMPPSTLVSGSLAVFAVDKGTGERLHLFSIESGDQLLPLSAPEGAAWEIAAVPLETSCLQPNGDVREWERIFALENWLTQIGKALARFRPAEDVEYLRSARALNVKPGRRYAVEAGVAIVRLEDATEPEAASKLVQQGALLSGVPVSSGACVVLTPGLWLSATAESEWKFLDSCDSSTMASTVSVAVQSLFESLDEVNRHRETADRERFLARQELNRQVTRTALRDLSGITGKPAGPDAAAPTGDPLFEAVRAVAVSLGGNVRPTAGSGRRADAVREIAQTSGMRTRTVILAGEWWRAENGPLVGHRDNGNPVALLPRRGGYQIVDMVAGTREKADKSTAAVLNPFAQMLYRPLPDDLSVAGLLRHTLSSRRGDIRTIAMAGLGVAVLGMAAPQGFAILIGQAIPDADRTMLLQIGAGIFAAAFGSAIFTLAQALSILRVQSGAFVTLQTGVWDRLLKLSPTFFRGFRAGQLRIRADAITRIHQLLSADALRSILGGVASLLSLALILWYSPVIALIALVSGLAILAQTWFSARALYRVQGEWQENEERLSGLMLQAINAVSKLRVAGAGNRAFSRWAREYSLMQKLALAMQSRKDGIQLFNMALPTVALALAYFYLLRQPVALGAFLACIVAMTAFLAAMTSASNGISALILVANKWQQTRTILDAKPEIDGAKTHPGRLRGAVSVENLTFRYRSDGPLALDDVSIRAEPGECIALTGPSGSGKSTLLNLILRFETPHSGAIYLDGRELSSLEITAVRRQIGVVTQDGRIMAGSLFENICPSGSNTMEEAWDAARAAGLAEDIEAMPMGMHTMVSEGGGNLSGGQRQRVLIARALVLKPSILIFDEATSALDNRTQAIVTESLNRLKATRILVAHRLSTIRRADRIYVIEKGKVVQQGRFDELVRQPGLFARLASRQKV
jgi:NHLM bacteriocin system ABC transporter ATP-binding protein